MQLDNNNNEALLAQLLEHIVAGNTLKSFRNIDEHTMEAMYAAGYQHYQSGNYDHANKLFQWLCMYDHFSVKYFKALAATQFVLKKYAEAINTYTACYFLDKDNPEHPLQAGLCHLAMGNLDEAESGFYASSLWGEDLATHVDVRKKANAMLELVKRKRQMKQAG